MTLGLLSILAAESAGEGEQSFFAGIAEAWNEGGWPMYPIALALPRGPSKWRRYCLLTTTRHRG